MRLYLLRHGVAFERNPRKYPRDAQRPLTPSGRAKMQQEARGMRALGLGFNVILTSPLTRCLQTARIVARGLKPVRRPVILRALAPGGAVREILAGIPKVSESGSVLLVGHEPDLSRLASELLLRMPVDFSIEFKKGGLCRIDFPVSPHPGSGRLVLLLPPRILRLID